MRTKKRAGLREGTYKYIESIISNYNEYPRLIIERERDLKNPYTVKDKNQGGGKSSITKNEVEEMAIKLISDKKLNTLKEEYRAIDNTFFTSDIITKRIIKLYYIDKPRTKTWDGVAYSVGYAKRHCYRLRDSFIKKVADHLGMT